MMIEKKGCNIKGKYFEISSKVWIEQRISFD